MPVYNNYRRQDIPAIPSISGLAGASTIAPTVSAASALQTDPNGASISISAPALATSVPPITVTPTTSAAAADSTSAPTSKSSSSNISTGTTIGACVGAVVGVVLLVLIALFFYRRYIRNLKTEAQAASEKRAARAKEYDDRSKKRNVENWNKMEEVGGEGKIRTKETLSPTGVGEMDFFQKSPTLRSPMSEKVTEENGPFDQPFARYHTMPDKKPSEPHPSAQHADPERAPPAPWSGKKLGTGSLLSLHSADIEKPSGTALSRAIPTPPAVEHQLHRWESAEVLHYDANPTPDDKSKVVDKKDSVSIGSKKRTDPFVEEAEARKNVDNPFFNAQDYTSHDSASPPLSIKAQGKQRQVDPFTDDNASPTMAVPRMPFGKHTPTDSTASYNSDRAIQSLVNVLDVSEEEIQERLRIASLQPSFVSTSTYPEEEADVTSTFPQPPT